MKATFKPYTLKFKFDAGTSRGVLTEKKTWFIELTSESGTLGKGECGPLAGLSIDDRNDFENYLSKVCKILENESLPPTTEECLKLAEKVTETDFPSLRFGIETALLDALNGGRRTIFNNKFSQGNQSIPINGLIWMGTRDFMMEQIIKKIEEGYTCLKLKIGSIDFDQECQLLEYIRSKFNEKDLSLRVDANGAFKVNEAREKLKVLSRYKIHSIEQPIKRGQWREMAELAEANLVPVALDEELIGIHNDNKKKELLGIIKPPYIILKPTLLGGINACREWIKLAEDRNIRWWITSALESNIGLNAIAQFTAEYDTQLHQGLGTGQLYYNNIESGLNIREGRLFLSV